MQIGTQNVPIWDFSCGELERAASAGGLRLSTLFPLVEAMPPSGQNSRRRNGAKPVDSCGKCGLLCKAHVVSAFKSSDQTPRGRPWHIDFCIWHSVSGFRLAV